MSVLKIASSVCSSFIDLCGHRTRELLEISWKKKMYRRLFLSNRLHGRKKMFSGLIWARNDKKESFCWHGTLKTAYQIYHSDQQKKKKKIKSFVLLKTGTIKTKHCLNRNHEIHTQKGTTEEGSGVVDAHNLFQGDREPIGEESILTLDLIWSRQYRSFT